MKVYLLLLSAALVPAAIPSQAVAHDFCFSTTVPDPNCRSDGEHTCVTFGPPNVAIACVGLHG